MLDKIHSYQTLHFAFIQLNKAASAIMEKHANLFTSEEYLPSEVFDIVEWFDLATLSRDFELIREEFPEDYETAEIIRKSFLSQQNSRLWKKGI
jgi:hypothetical protein